MNSSNLNAYRYDEDSQELEIEFHGGRTYTYNGVPKDVASGLETTSSPGSYFWSKIKRYG